MHIQDQSIINVVELDKWLYNPWHELQITTLPGFENFQDSGLRPRIKPNKKGYCLYF